MVEGGRFEIRGIAAVNIVGCAWIVGIMYRGYSVLWPEAQILRISSSRGREWSGLETARTTAGAGVLSIWAEGADIGLGTSGLAEQLLSVGTTSGLLMAAAVTICMMVERIVLSWAVLTKVESLGREALACGAIRIAVVDVGASESSEAWSGSRLVKSTGRLRKSQQSSAGATASGVGT